MSKLRTVAAAIEDATEAVRISREAQRRLRPALQRPGLLDQYTVVLNPEARDGDVIVSKRRWTIQIGTRPWTEIETAGWEARRIVRTGLADVLDWLGRDLGPARPITHHDLLAVLGDRVDVRALRGVA